jgi:hypothetical protein
MAEVSSFFSFMQTVSVDVTGRPQRVRLRVAGWFTASSIPRVPGCDVSTGMNRLAVRRHGVAVLF